MGSIQYRVLGQWGPAPWMWGTAGAGATHTLVREQGQRSAAGRVARLWPPLQAPHAPSSESAHCLPSWRMACSLGPGNWGWPPALMCCLDVCPKTGPSAAGPGVDLGAHLGHPSRLQLCWVGGRRRQGPGAPCPLVSRALCLHTDISGSGSLRCSAGGWGSGQVWGSQHHQGMPGSGPFGSLSGQPHPLPSSTPELEAFPSLNKRQSPGFSHGLPHGSWQVSGEARGTGA